MYRAVMSAKVTSANARDWLAVVDAETWRRIARRGLGSFRLPSFEDALVQPGDRIEILVTHRPLFVREARLVASADVAAVESDGLLLRHRFVAPSGHEPALQDLRMLRVALGWTHELLGALVGSLLPLPLRDHQVIEAALREVALAYGPAASRPAHRRPRTPGRRALIEGRAAWRPVVRGR